MRYLYLSILLAALACGCLLSVAGSTDARADVPTSADSSVAYSTFRGRVTDAVTGQPVTNARVTATGTGSFITCTDTSGSFALIDMPTGEYAVSIVPLWHVSWRETNVFTADQLEGELVFRLAHGTGVLYGKVMSAGHESGHSGASVIYAGQSSGKARVSGNGEYLVTNAPAGVYALYIGARAHQPREVSNVCVFAGCTVTNITKLELVDARLLKELVLAASEAEDRGDYEAAIGTYAETIKLQPCAKAYGNRAVLRLKAKDYEGAVQDFVAGLNWSPGSKWLMLGLAEAYEFLSDSSNAVAILTQLISRSPDDANLYRRRARLRFVQHDTNGVMDDLALCLKHADDIADAHYQRARVYYEMGWLKAVEEEIRKAVDLKPRNADYLYFRAQTLFYTEGDSSAFEVVTDVLEVDRNHAPAHNLLGMLYSNRKHWPGAEREFSRALSIEPSFIEAYVGRAKARKNLGQTDEALADYNAALCREPDYVLALLGRSGILITRREYDAALKDLNRVLELKPDDSIALYNRSIVYEQLGKPELAREDRKRRALSGRRR